MPAWFPIVLMICGLAILAASLLYAREVLHYRRDRIKTGELMDRAMLASRLPPEESQREFDLIRQEFRVLIDGSPAAPVSRDAPEAAPPLTSRQ
jgi:hypothetical protein